MVIPAGRDAWVGMTEVSTGRAVIGVGLTPSNRSQSTRLFEIEDFVKHTSA
jgi:hypothetical protein